MARRKSSPVPRLVTNEELNRYQGISLRLRETKTQGPVVYVCYRDPLRGGLQTTRAAGTTREQVLAVLDATARLVSESPPDALAEALQDGSPEPSERPRRPPWLRQHSCSRVVGDQSTSTGTIE